MKLLYEVVVLTCLFFYSALSIALLGPWMYRKARSLLGEFRPSSEATGEPQMDSVEASPNSGQAGSARKKRPLGAPSVASPRSPRSAFVTSGLSFPAGK